MAEKITQRTLLKLEATGKPYFIRDEDLKGFGIKVTAKGKASYIVEARVRGGRPVRKEVGSVDLLSLADARLEAREMLLKLRKGRDIAKEVPVEDTPPESLGRTLETYLENSRHEIKLETASNYRNTINNCFRDWLPRPVNMITREDVQQRYATLRDDRSDAYAQKAMRYLRAILNSADVSPNPVSSFIKKSKVSLTPKPRDRYLNAYEVATIRDAAAHAMTSPDFLKNQNYLIYPILLFYMEHGLRRTELLTIKVEDVDFQLGTVSIWDTKNKDPHIIPITGHWKEWLKDIRDANVPPTIDTNAPFFGFTESNLRTQENKAREYLNFNTPWTIHDLRRTFAEHSFLLGYDELAIALAENQRSTGGVTRRHYLGGGLGKMSLLTKMYTDLQKQFLWYSYQLKRGKLNPYEKAPDSYNPGDEREGMPVAYWDALAEVENAEEEVEVLKWLEEQDQ